MAASSASNRVTKALRLAVSRPEVPQLIRHHVLGSTDQPEVAPFVQSAVLDSRRISLLESLWFEGPDRLQPRRDG